MNIFYRILLAWTRLDLMIARSAPVQNIRLIERLRREESEFDRELILLDVSART